MRLALGSIRSPVKTESYLFVCQKRKRERERKKERKKVKTKMCFKNIFESFPSKCASEKRGDSEQMFDLCKNDIYE